MNSRTSFYVSGLFRSGVDGRGAVSSQDIAEDGIWEGITEYRPNTCSVPGARARAGAAKVCARTMRQRQRWEAEGLMANQWQ